MLEILVLLASLMIYYLLVFAQLLLGFLRQSYLYRSEDHPEIAKTEVKCYCDCHNKVYPDAIKFAPICIHTKVRGCLKVICCVQNIFVSIRRIVAQKEWNIVVIVAWIWINRVGWILADKMLRESPRTIILRYVGHFNPILHDE